MFGIAVKEHDSRAMQRVFTDVQEFNTKLQSVDPKAKKRAFNRAIFSYVISSMFLNQCFKELNHDDKEQFFFITGTEINDTYALGQPMSFLHDSRSRLGVVGNVNDTHRVLIELGQFGHKLLGHFHIHPGIGAGATHPSGTDERFQHRLESAGYPSVAAIFSRDGFVRFFRMDKKFELKIHGKGIEQYGKDIFRLTNVDHA